MNIILKIPKEFEEHYKRDFFIGSLQRVDYDIRSLEFKGLSGNYELETLEMLIVALWGSFPLSPHEGKLNMNSIYGKSAIYADTDKGFMKDVTDTNVGNIKKEGETNDK